MTPLMRVCVCGDIRMAKALCGAGAGLHQISAEKLRAKEYAQRKGHLEIVRMLEALQDSDDKYDEDDSEGQESPTSPLEISSQATSPLAASRSRQEGEAEEQDGEAKREAEQGVENIEEGARGAEGEMGERGEGSATGHPSRAGGQRTGKGVWHVASTVRTHVRDQLQSIRPLAEAASREVCFHRHTATSAHIIRARIFLASFCR